MTQEGPFRRLPPGLGSVRGRFTYLAGLLSLLLVCTAMAGRWYVQHGTRLAVDKIQARTQLRGTLDDLLRQLGTVEKHLERFVLQPSVADRTRLAQSLQLLEVARARLHGHRWGTEDPTVPAIAGLVESDLKRLRESGDELIRTRLDVNRWFPVSLTMEQELLPHSRGFSDALDGLLNELEPAAAGELYRVVVELRHSWTRMTSEFRLFVANRLGVFSVDPQAGMAGRATNVALYGRRISALLQQLETLSAEEDNGFLAGDLAPRLRAHRDAWLNGYQRVSRDLGQAGWRRDLVLLNRDIDPLIESLRQRLGGLAMALELHSARDITLLTRTAQDLSDLILGLAAMGILAILAGYLLFQRSLLRPVAVLTRALKNEALGQTHGPLPPANLEETRDLLQAFQWMRHQVRERQSHLNHLAHHDTLTGLPNRLLFGDRLEHALRLAGRSGTRLAVLFIDLDRFKAINDTHGHTAGDLVLVEVAARLERELREADTVARISGDEFAVMMEGIETREEVTGVVEKLLHSLQQPYRIDGEQLRLSASIGITLGPRDAREAGDLVRDADAAMYEAKRRGRNGFRYFSRSPQDDPATG